MSYDAQQQHQRFRATFPNATLNGKTYYLETVLSGEKEMLSNSSVDKTQG